MATSLRLEGISKRFGRVQALDDVSAEFRAGRVHAVLGENGAGKSTLVGVLSGFVKPERGEVRLDGVPLALGKPHVARKAGIAMVHQHFTLVPQLTVQENLALGRIERLDQRLHLEARAEPALSLARALGWPLEPMALVEDLPVGIRQRIEILKCLAGGALVAVFDEPTAVLTPEEVDELFWVLRSLRDRGFIVILIAHKLSEIMQIADEVTVLRGGRRVASASIAEVTRDTLTQWMVGEVPASQNLPPPELPGRLLRVKDLVVRGDRGEQAVQGVNFCVAGGEVVGIGGVDGNGQLELAEALAGVRPVESGVIAYEGGPGSATVAYVPQDRQAQALALEMSVEDNLLIAGHASPKLSRHGVFRRRAVLQWCQAIVQRFDIKAADIDVPVSTLSGGNQQKVVVGRSLQDRPDVLVACGPTRGLDVRATEFVRAALRQAASEGCAVVLISGDREELSETAHRVLTLSRGRLEDA